MNLPKSEENSGFDRFSVVNAETVQQDAESRIEISSRSSVQDLIVHDGREEDTRLAELKARHERLRNRNIELQARLDETLDENQELRRLIEQAQQGQNGIFPPLFPQFSRAVSPDDDPFPFQATDSLETVTSRAQESLPEDDFVASQRDATGTQEETRNQVHQARKKPRLEQ